MRKLVSTLTFLALFLLPLWSLGAPWPGEPWQQAQNLTALDDNFVKNLSGAHWNPETRTLWVAVNSPGKFLAVVEDGAGGYKIAQRNGLRGEWSPGGDLEGITQVDLREEAIYVISEGEEVIRKYDTTIYGASKLLQFWSIAPFVPTSGAAGSEGITFVPDSALVGFVDKNGAPYTSKNGMGGLMFVAHQNGGALYAFDLSPTGAVSFVGSYKTSRSESSGLEFDRSTGRLYVWHNTGENYLEVVGLTSVLRADGTRQLQVLQEYVGPKTGNLESVALAPVKSREHTVFITDDDNQQGAALMVFKKVLFEVKQVTATVFSAMDDAEENLTTGAVNLVSTDLELVRDAADQLVGIRFAVVGLPPGVNVLRATLQFATDEATSLSTSLTIHGQLAIAAPSFTTTARNISSRTKTVASVVWSPEPWSTLLERGPKQLSPDLKPILQELASQPGWTAASPVVFLISGVGKRVAKSYNGDKALAPVLFVEFEP